MLLRRTFDVPARDLETDEAQEMLEDGVLEVIEPGDDVVGVALTIDAEDWEEVLTLARACGGRGSVLEREIFKAVAELAPLYGEDPALDRFRIIADDPVPTDDVEVVLHLATGTDR